MPVRAGIPFIAIATHLVIMQHGPQGGHSGRGLYSHCITRVSLCYQVPAEAAENRKEEAQNVLRQPGTSQTSKRSLLQLQQIPFFLLTPWELVRACFQLQNDDRLSLFPSELSSSENVLLSLEGLRVDGLVFSCWS